MNLHNTYGVCIENHVLMNFTAQEMVWPKLSGRESRKYSKLQPYARWEWEKLRTFHLDILEGCTTGDGTTSESHRIVIEICFVQALCRRSWMNVSKRRLEEKKIKKNIKCSIFRLFFFPVEVGQTFHRRQALKVAIQKLPESMRGQHASKDEQNSLNWFNWSFKFGDKWSSIPSNQKQFETYEVWWFYSSETMWCEIWNRWKELFCETVRWSALQH